jgi:hypothetical protein
MSSLHTASFLCIIAVTGVLTGCERAPDLSNPVERQGMWFGILEGADLKARCEAGGTFWRAVYNGTYEKQVRVYTIIRDGASWQFSSFGRGQMNLSPLAIDLEDPLAPLRGQQTAKTLSASQGQEADALLTANHQPLTRSQNLEGDDYWWLIHHCDKGVWTTAALRPQDGARFSAYAPAALLQKLAGDTAQLEGPPPVPEFRKRDERRFDFTITARPNGLASMPKLL